MWKWWAIVLDTMVPIKEWRNAVVICHVVVVVVVVVVVIASLSYNVQLCSW